MNKVLSLNSDTRVRHEAGILHSLITAFLLIDPEAELWFFSAVIIFMFITKERHRHFI